MEIFVSVCAFKLVFSNNISSFTEYIENCYCDAYKLHPTFSNIYLSIYHVC